MPPVLYLFALCNLVIGSGAFVLGGILVPLAGSLDISVAAAGQAMTAYAVATAILAHLGWVGVAFCLLALLTLAFEPAQARPRATVAS